MEVLDEIAIIHPPKKKSRFRRILKWVLISLGSFIVLIFAAALIIVNFFEDDIKKFAIAQINNEVKTKIEVEDISLSLFKKFPLASLEFKNVKCQEVSYDSQKENLLEAESIFLEFSIWDIFRKKYKFKKLSVENGKLDLEIDAQGRSNFDILKEKKQEKNKDQKDEGFKFSEFKLKNIETSFVNAKEKNNLLAHIDNFNCSGEFSKKEFQLNSKAKLRIYYLQIDQDQFLTNKSLTLKNSFTINTVSKICKIKYANLEIEKMTLDINGSIKMEPENQIDLSFEGKNLNIQSFLSILPESYKQFEKDYKSKGKFYLKGDIKGVLSKNKFPDLNISFGVSEAEVKFVKNNHTLKNFKCEGTFTSHNLNAPEKSQLNITHFWGELNNSQANGNLELKNFLQPELKFSLNADLDLIEVFSFIKNDQIEDIGGRLKLDINYSGKMKGNEFTLNDYKNSTTQGDASLSDVTLKIKGKPLALYNCNGNINFENSDANIPALTGKLNSTQFNLSGSAKNLTEFFILDDYPLIVESELQCDQLQIEDFLSAGSKTSDHNKTIRIPQNVDLTLTTEIGRLNFKNFEAQHIKGLVILKNQQLIAKHIEFESSGGTAEISGSVDAKNESEIKTSAFGTFQNIEIDRLFNAFDNFSQKTLKSKHLKGKVNATITYSATFDKNLKMNKKTLYVYCPLEISNGELINFKPLEALSQFISLEELRHIKFSKLTNNIEIKDESVIIPKMIIQSSALNMEIGGVHYFDNRIEYYFNILLKDLLAKKFKKNKKQEEFGEIIEEEGGARIYLKMIGTMEKHKISVDGKGVREKIKDDIKNENQELKQIFSDEFGSFKNDSTIKKSNLQPKKKKKNKINESDEFEFNF